MIHLGFIDHLILLIFEHRNKIDIIVNFSQRITPMKKFAQMMLVQLFILVELRVLQKVLCLHMEIFCIRL